MQTRPKRARQKRGLLGCFSCSFSDNARWAEIKAQAQEAGELAHAIRWAAAVAAAAAAAAAKKWAKKREAEKENASSGPWRPM